jgi:hypothetical protein
VNRVSPEALWIGGFGLLMGALSLMLWLWGGDRLFPALLTGAAVSMALLALYIVAGGTRTIESRRLADSSLPTVVLVFGLAMMLNGLEFGLWLILIGGEVAVFGLVLLVRELIVFRGKR